MEFEITVKIKNNGIKKITIHNIDDVLSKCFLSGKAKCPIYRN
jgi:hypothetical protein